MCSPRLIDVELFERHDRPGGHVNTVRYGGLALDTGFIVHNEPNYPVFGRLLRELGVATRRSEMSFSVSCGDCGLEWSGRRPFAQGRRLGGHTLPLAPDGGRPLAANRRGGAPGREPRGANPRGVHRRARVLATLPPSLPDAAGVRALVELAGACSRLSGRVRDPLLRATRHARPSAAPLENHRRRRQHVRGRVAGTPARPGSSRSGCARGPARRLGGRDRHRGWRDPPLRQGRAGDACGSVASAPRRSER